MCDPLTHLAGLPMSPFLFLSFPSCCTLAKCTLALSHGVAFLALFSGRTYKPVSEAALIRRWLSEPAPSPLQAVLPTSHLDQVASSAGQCPGREDRVRRLAKIQRCFFLAPRLEPSQAHSCKTQRDDPFSQDSCYEGRLSQPSPFLSHLVMGSLDGGMRMPGQ